VEGLENCFERKENDRMDKRRKGKNKFCLWM
jgi:hypothetical protein